MTYDEAVRWYENHGGIPDWDEDEQGAWHCTVQIGGESVTRTTADRSQAATREVFTDAVRELAARVGGS